MGFIDQGERDQAAKVIFKNLSDQTFFLFTSVSIDTLSILSSNIRGMGNTKVRNNIRDNILKFKPGIINIHESKCNSLSDSMKDFIWPLADHEWSISPAQHKEIQAAQ